MNATSIRLDPAVLQRTLEKKLTDLPPLPAVVMQILNTINNPNANAEDLQRLISMEPALAAKVLRIVNSSYYGLPKRVSAVSQAVMILGFNTVRNLVLGIAALGQFPSKNMPYGLNREQFWRHSAAVAVGASTLAKHRLPRNRSASEEGFIGGLLHDLGTLFLDSYFPMQYAVSMAFAQREERVACKAERATLGMDHARVGRRIAEHWSFPAHLSTIIGEHHTPNPSAENSAAISLVHAADWMAWKLGAPSSKYPQAPELDSNVAEWLNFSEEAWSPIYEETMEQLHACEEMIRMAQES